MAMLATDFDLALPVDAGTRFEIVAETGAQLRLEVCPNATRSIALDGVFVRPAP